MNQNQKTACLYLGTAALLFVSTLAFADDTGIGARASAIQESIKPIIQLIKWAAYIMGVGFALAGMLKFKAHKEQPVQVPLSQPIVLLLIAAGLVGLPAVVDIMKGTLLGEGAKTDFEFQ
jgi:intracellular multiplication protein IcmD